MTRTMGRTQPAALTLVLFVMLLGASAGCTGPDERVRPGWIDGPTDQFPPERFLIGLGQADSQPVATDRAYAAVARIFRAEVTALARDWESYMLLERRGKTTHERKLTIDNVTQVSTDKVLENVQVLDTWHEPEGGTYYALAGMNRSQAEAAVLERIREIDGRVSTEVRTARRTDDKLLAIRNIKRAANHLVMREAYNADLRVIRVSGQGHPPTYRVAELTAELEELINANLIIDVDVTGEQAETIRRAVIEGLVREGLPVTGRPLGAEAPSQPSDDQADNQADRYGRVVLLVKGSGRLWQADVPDPMFRYVRWCSDFVIMDVQSGRIVGAVSRQGREGHLTYQEAMNRAIKVMERELTADLAKSLAGYVYGEPDEAAGQVPPAACPQDNGRAMSPVHAHHASL